MWNLAGHEIGLAGGPYMADHGDPMTAIHCHQCPDGTEKGWMVWSCPDELGEAVPIEEGLAAVVVHLREDGVDVSDDSVGAAAMLAGLDGYIEPGLNFLADLFWTRQAG